MTTALLVIDVQQSFVQAPYWRPDDAPVFLSNINRLIAGAQAKGVPVVRVLHVEFNGTPFDPANGLIRDMEGLDAYDSAFEVRKERHSAFVGSRLGVELRTRGINHLIIAGIRTEQCCETTTRHGSDEGFQVDYVTEATLTFPMVHADGSTFAPADIKQRTETVLRGRFATICTVDEALARC
jgi:nicotinamidase-related amidase